MRGFTAHAAAEADDPALLAHLLAETVEDDLAERQAARLLARFGSLAAALAAPVSEIARALDPPSRPCAERVKTLHRLVLAVLRSTVAERPLIRSSRALRAYLHVSLAHEAREQVRVLYLDLGGHLIRDEIAGAGTIDHAPLYPREVVRRALDLGARSLVLVHNHPSGDPAPSAGDIEMTSQVRAACAGLDLELIDHLVIGRHGVVSFRAAGLLDARGPRRDMAERRGGAARRVAAS